LLGLGLKPWFPNDFKRITRYPKALPWVRFAQIDGVAAAGADCNDPSPCRPTCAVD